MICNKLRPVFLQLQEIGILFRLEKYAIYFLLSLFSVNQLQRHSGNLCVI